MVTEKQLKISEGCKKTFENGRKPSRYMDGKWNKRKRKNKVTILNWCTSNNIYRLPTGCMIHHIDQNPLNNDSDNLKLMTKDFHNKLHNEYFKNNGK